MMDSTDLSIRWIRWENHMLELCGMSMCVSKNVIGAWDIDGGGAEKKLC